MINIKFVSVKLPEILKITRNYPYNFEKLLTYMNNKLSVISLKTRKVILKFA